MIMIFTRSLRYQLPFFRGEDVLQVQLRLEEFGYRMVGQPDGKFDIKTDAAVRVFQKAYDLKVDGIVGPDTWKALFEGAVSDVRLSKLQSVLPDLTNLHGYHDSVQWKLQTDGLYIKPTGIEKAASGQKIVQDVWERFGQAIEEWSEKFGVPAELIVATICTESEGNPEAVRLEPGYQSDKSTPDKVSPGLMQTLISTARWVLGEEMIDRQWLIEPGNSIRAGTAYIANQWKSTCFDPPKVACAYNAGSVRYNDSEKNRWKMLQYPSGTSQHADRFVQWFNEFFAVMDKNEILPALSFRRELSS
jgi:hypothetical protein